MDKLKFEAFGISKEILETLDTLGYKNPTEVQEQVIPLALEGRDIIVKSQTGSGKTGSFAIPICEKIDLEERRSQVLVLTPTRELAMQVSEEMTNIGRFKKVRCAAIFGKQPINAQIIALRQRIHVIVGTPGRTLDLISKGHMNVDHIKYLIIDEADEMLNMGFIEQVEAIIDELPSNRITMLFSATMPEEIESISQKYMIDPTKVEITPKSLASERIQQVYYEVEKKEKFDALNKIIYSERPDSCILFCGTKESVDELVYKMKNKGYPCRGLHGGMFQKDRIDTIEKFKRGEFNFLVATNLAARGIDIENVTHIINYDIPMENENYVHRIGRTGRLGNTGMAITFVSPSEHKYLEKLEEYLGYEIIKKEIPSDNDLNKNISDKTSFISKPKLKVNKADKLNKDIMKIYINAGKNKKIRPGDIVGAITNIKGISADDIGIIDVQERCSYIDIHQGKGNLVVSNLKNSTIKGKAIKVHKARD
jgi:ATP-dependent RNA helicase DeaD